VSPEPAIKDEDGDADAEIRMLEEKLNAAREKRKFKRVKTESKPVFISGEVIDLT